jgi:hypothetical protein
MRRNHKIRYALFAGILLSAAGILLAQTTPNRVLIVNGKSVGPIIREIDGRSYVDLNTLAQATNGTLTLEPTRVVLTIPGAAPALTPASIAAQAAPASGPAVSEALLSREFASAAIGELEEMREFRGAVGAMITYGLAASSASAQEYHDQIEAGLSQAAVVATTDPDQKALGLLRNEYDKLTAWSNQIFTERQNLNGSRTIDPNALQKDTALGQIRACGQFLNTMIVSGVFSDSSDCH